MGLDIARPINGRKATYDLDKKKPRTSSLTYLCFANTIMVDIIIESNIMKV
jgi:hypothetical protein